ncbi:MAG TPA: 16S rRNA (cytosine(1402)-N(4))-methyltransferase RsmH, partial [Puia sp.]|nr:16S rRNA (cytosine(1402)-N(4))-methyltransferase RsmH [Puia sp.]
GGVYVDGTFGGGGHAREILRRLSSEGRLYLFDQDEDARRNLPDDTRIHFFPHNFRHMQRFLRLHKVGPVDGVLADLGVSSHQFDEPARGFSTRFDGDLDMRMDQRQSLTAFEVIHTYPEQRLHKIFEQYGEVTNAKTLAKKIVEVRQAMPLRTIASFRHAIAEVVKGNPHKYLAQVFQALRIEVNQELEALRDMLTQLPALLKPGGRVAIITFHSLEDRLVKQFFKNGSFDDGQENSDPFGQHTHAKLFRLINRKPIVPSAAEMTQNPRSRSARLRVAEKI